MNALGVHGGLLYATSFDGGAMARFDGTNWQELGNTAADVTQNYSFAAYQNELQVVDPVAGMQLHILQCVGKDFREAAGRVNLLERREIEPWQDAAVVLGQSLTGEEFRAGADPFIGLEFGIKTQAPGVHHRSGRKFVWGSQERA